MNVASVSEKKISEGVEHLSVVASKIKTSNDEKILAITKLLEHYKSVVGASNSLIDKLNSIDFPSKLDALFTKTQVINESITDAKKTWELKSNETQTSINDNTILAKEQIIQSTDIQIRSLAEQVNNSNDNIRKTILDKFDEHAINTEISIENLKGSLKEYIMQINLCHDKQEKEIKIVKKIILIVSGFIAIGAVALIFIIKQRF